MHTHVPQSLVALNLPLHPHLDSTLRQAYTNHKFGLINNANLEESLIKGESLTRE